jgi:tetratricopeptide (TPR) repeat protein
VALLCEDLHWCDDASLQFLDELSRSLESGPLAVIGFGRDAARPIGGDGRVRVELGPLPDAAAAEIARAIAPAAAPALITELVTRAAGNPFFVEELARELKDRGDAPGSLPATVEAVVQARLDRLEPRAREVACAAAVVGREFWRDAARVALAEPAAIDDAELDGLLAELEQRGILSPLPPSAVDDERYVFHGALVRDVAYQQLAPRDRRRAHQAVARWLEPRVGAHDRGDPALLAAVAWHRDQGGDAAGAHQAYRRSGERALALFAYREAASALRRARELGTEEDPTLLESLGEALANAESVAAGEQAYQAALAAAGADPVRRARLHHKLATCQMRRSDHTGAVDTLRAGLALVAPGDQPTPAALAAPAVLAALYGTLGWVLGYQLTDNAQGLACSERAVALLEGTVHRRELASALSRLGANYMRAGRFAEQLRCNLRNLAIGEEIGDLDMQITGHINLGVAYATLGRVDDAIVHTRKALELCARTQAVTTAALARSNLAGLLLDRGDLGEAELHLEQAIAAAERAGVRNFLPEAFGFAARIRLASGDLDGAERAARRALEHVSSPSIDEGIASRILAGVLMRRGRLDDAAAELARARDRLTAEPLELARTQVVEARLAAQRGDAGGAAALRGAAAAELARLGATLDVARLDDVQDLR